MNVTVLLSFVIEILPLGFRWIFSRTIVRQKSIINKTRITISIYPHRRNIYLGSSRSIITSTACVRKK
ncbi:MAG: hypothetical protein AAFW70_20270 [Cyanobacteria bacterium J06635_10]